MDTVVDFKNGLDWLREPLPSAGLCARALAALAPRTLEGGLRLAGGVALAASGCYVSYGVYRGVRSLGTRFKRWRAGPPMMVPAPQAPEVGEKIIPESAVAGSTEYLMTPPGGQCVAGYCVDNTFYVSGCAVRIDQWLVIPDHVKSAIQDHPLTLRSHSGIEVVPDVKQEDFIQVDTDLLAITLPESAFSRLGLSKLKVADLPDVAGNYVSVVGAYGKGTTGTLRHSVLFGKVDYSGSTFKGYSGGAYTRGSQILGVHLHGGATNSGYSASYILCMLKYYARVRDEDTADWLDAVKRTKKKVRYEASWGLEDVKLRVGGRYHIVARDEVRRAYGEDWERTLTEPAQENWRYRPEPVHADGAISSECAGECPAQTSGASSALIISGPKDDELLYQLTRSEWLAFKRYLKDEAAKKKSTQPSTTM